MNNSCIKKVGTPQVKMPDPMATTSSLLPLLEAARIPNGTPTIIVPTNAEPNRSTVLTSRHDISSATGFIDLNEKPKFHVNML